MNSNLYELFNYELLVLALVLSNQMTLLNLIAVFYLSLCYLIIQQI